jgi:hypothetical protein
VGRTQTSENAALTRIRTWLVGGRSAAAVSIREQQRRAGIGRYCAGPHADEACLAGCGVAVISSALPA